MDALRLTLFLVVLISAGCKSAVKKAPIIGLTQAQAYGTNSVPSTVDIKLP